MTAENREEPYSPLHNCSTKSSAISNLQDYKNEICLLPICMLTLKLLYLCLLHCSLCILSQYNPKPAENHQNIEENFNIVLLET